MVSSFHIKAEELIAVIGPSISPEVYKVGNELLENFQNAGFHNQDIFCERSGKQYHDLWTTNKILLTQAGVIGSNIEISGYCTFTQHEKFFSARRLGIKSGRIVSGIMLKQH